jgi:hypothetical protein
LQNWRPCERNLPYLDRLTLAGYSMDEGGEAVRSDNTQPKMAAVRRGLIADCDVVKRILLLFLPGNGGIP